MKCTHDYPVSELPRTYCSFGCGCFISAAGDGGPEGIDPRGKCPVVETIPDQATFFRNNFLPAFG